MKHSLIVAILLFALTASFGQKVGSIDRGELIKLLNHSNDTVYVLNFWATWCSPCVAEIEYFESLHRMLSDNKLKVVLVNLDFPNQLEQRVIPFVEEKKLTAPVMNMTEMDYNSWISIVDSDWSGAIPATLIFKGANRKFIPGEVSREELFEAVDPFFADL
ncbi:MAG: TlpA family protein disulfide reductase [Bacteroidales bacterium]